MTIYSVLIYTVATGEIQISSMDDTSILFYKLVSYVGESINPKQAVAAMFARCIRC